MRARAHKWACILQTSRRNSFGGGMMDLRPAGNRVKSFVCPEGCALCGEIRFLKHFVSPLMLVNARLYSMSCNINIISWLLRCSHCNKQEGRSESRD